MKPTLELIPGFVYYTDYTIDGQSREQWLFRFNNGYGASVISGYGAYADKEHPYELAVLFFDGDTPSLAYPKTIKGDGPVERLDADGVENILKRISEFPALTRTGEESDGNNDL